MLESSSQFGEGAGIHPVTEWSQPLKDSLAPTQIILQGTEEFPQCCHSFFSAPSMLWLGIWDRAMTSSCLCSRFTAWSPWGQIHCHDRDLGMMQRKGQRRIFVSQKKKKKKKKYFKILFKFVALKASFLPWEF